MSPETKTRVRDSWQLVVPIAETAATLFYDRLFALDPTLRPLFAHADLAAQRRKLVAVLATAVGALDRIETLVPTVQALGRRHVAYGVTDAHYATVGAALLWTLEQGLGEAWTAETAAAWTEVYTLLSGVMRAAAADAPPLRAAA